MALGGALREVFAVLGVEVDPEHNLEKGHKEVDSLKEGFEGLVAAFAGSELFHMTREFGEELGHLKIVSEQTGIATDSLQTLDFAAQLTGGSVDEMNNSLVILQRSLSHTQEQTGPQVKALTELGISFRDAAGQPKPLNDILPQVFENFGKLKSSAQEAEVATSLFGRGGVKLLPTLREGAEGLEEFRAQLDELGGPVSEDTINKAEEMNKSFARMDRALFNLKATIGSEVFPQIEKMLTGVAHGIAAINDFAKGTTLAESGSIALGIAIAGPLLTALGPLLKPGLKFAALYLAFDDALAFFEGKDSVLGAAIGALFGPEALKFTQDWAKGVRTAFKELADDGVPIFHAIGVGWASTLNDMIKAFDEFILAAEKKWNELAPAFLKIDTTDAEKRVADAAKAQEGFAQQAYDETHPEEVKKREEAQQGAFESENGKGRRDEKLSPDQIREAFLGTPAPKDNVRRGEGFTPPQQAARDAEEAHDPQAVFRALRAQAAERAAVQGPKPLSFPEFAPAPVVPTTAHVPTGGAVHNEYHVDARTTVNAPTTGTAKDVADLVGKTQKENWRNAYESLTSRSNAAP